MEYVLAILIFCALSLLSLLGALAYQTWVVKKRLSDIREDLS